MIGIDEENMSFWEGFMEQVTEFRTKCQDLSENEMLLLCSEPSKNIQTIFDTFRTFSIYQFQIPEKRFWIV